MLYSNDEVAYLAKASHDGTAVKEGEYKTSTSKFTREATKEQQTEAGSEISENSQDSEYSDDEENSDDDYEALRECKPRAAIAGVIARIQELEKRISELTGIPILRLGGRKEVIETDDDTNVEDRDAANEIAQEEDLQAMRLHMRKWVGEAISGPSSRFRKLSLELCDMIVRMVVKDAEENNWGWDGEPLTSVNRRKRASWDEMCEEDNYGVEGYRTVVFTRKEIIKKLEKRKAGKKFARGKSVMSSSLMLCAIADSENPDTASSETGDALSDAGSQADGNESDGEIYSQKDSDGKVYSQEESDDSSDEYKEERFRWRVDDIASDDSAFSDTENDSSKREFKEYAIGLYPDWSCWRGKDFGSEVKKYRAEVDLAEKKLSKLTGIPKRIIQAREEPPEDYEDIDGDDEEELEAMRLHTRNWVAETISRPSLHFKKLSPELCGMIVDIVVKGTEEDNWGLGSEDVGRVAAMRRWSWDEMCQEEAGNTLSMAQAAFRRKRIIKRILKERKGKSRARKQFSTI